MGRMSEPSITVPDPLGVGEVRVVRFSNLFGSKVPMRRGKVRDVYDLGDHLILYTTDRVSAFDAVLPTPIPHKGRSLHLTSVYWFERTRHIFPNHYVESLDDRTMKVVKAERIGIEWVVRRYLYGSAWRAYTRGVRVVSGVKLPNGLRMAEELPDTILTPTTKSDVGHDVEITKSEAISRRIVSKDEWDELEEASFRLYEFYATEAKRRGIVIPDFKLEYGRTREGLIQIDEPPTHDSARLWVEKYYEVGRPQEAHCLDKEFLRAYLRSVGFRGEGKPPEIPWPVVVEVSKRCVYSYRVISGQMSVASLDIRPLEEVLEEAGLR